MAALFAALWCLLVAIPCMSLPAMPGFLENDILDPPSATSSSIDEITSFPGYKSKLTSKHYGGYITVDNATNRSLFYYLVLSEGNPSVDPLVLWLNGGPGCSSFDGFIYEHGPFAVSPDGKTLTRNENTWSQSANMLYLDSPAGVGFSFSNSTDDYATDDTKTAQDTNTFLRLFLGQRHPELANNRFFAAGESYAGIYVPTLMRRIVEGNAAGELPKIAAEGYMVGNGCTDPVFDGNALIPYVHGKSLISDAQYSSVKKACGGSYWNASTDGSQCGIGLSKIDEILGGLNIYDTLDRCYRGGDEKDTRLSEELPKMTVGRAWPAMAAVKPGRVATWPELTRKLRGAPPCIDDRAAFALLNSPSVRKAIHASPLAGEWKLCTDKLTYTHDIPTMIPIHEGLLKEGFRALIYSGDHDMCVPHTGSEAWTRSLGMPTVDDWRPWTIDDDQVAGYTQTYKSASTANLTYATVLGAGHTVPEYKPRESLQMFQRFLANVPL